MTINKSETAQLQRWSFPQEYFELSRKILDTALEKVAAYQNWRMLDPGPDYSVDVRYSALPVLTKKDIREHFPGGMLPADCDLNQALHSGEVNLVETSGTTEDKITNIWNQKWWDASERASWKLNSDMARIATGNHREAILVNARNVGLVSDTEDLPMEKRRLARFLYLNEKTDPIAWTTGIMDRMIAELSIFQPAVLEANPSMLAQLCRYILATNKTVFQPAVIVFTYEYPSLLHYRQIKKVFKAPTVSSYGTTESGYVFMQCEYGKFHQNSEYCRVDFQPFRKEQGGPRLGRILATPLRNPWAYLLRFDTGDIGCLEESGKCPCGRNSGIILSSLQGRKVNLTLTCSDRLITLNELDNAICKLEGIDEYKLIQPDIGVYELHLVSQIQDKSIIEGKAIEILKNLYGKESRISIVHETAIRPENNGKYLLAKTLFPIDLNKYLETGKG